MIQLSDITYRIGERTLLNKASLGLPKGARAGLVGHNGVGKTTLFRLMTGAIPIESGSLSLPRNARIGQVAQEAPAGEESLLEVVLAADRERSQLIQEADSATDAHRIAEIHTRLADIDAHSAEARASSVLAGLGFDHADQTRPCSSFSGGWRMRVALAAVLFSEPDVLLLDEPTNYLDLEGTVWLSSFLARYKHTSIVISHDRDLLDEAVDMIVHLDQGKLFVYRGGYSQFDRQRRERQALQLKLRKKQQAQRKHMEDFVERFRAKATKARQAQSRLKALERMEPIAELVNQHILPVCDSERGASGNATNRVARCGVSRLSAGSTGPFRARLHHRERRPHRSPRPERQWQVYDRALLVRPFVRTGRAGAEASQAEGWLFRPAPAG